MYISNNLPGDAGSAGLGVTQRLIRLCEHFLKLDIWVVYHE